MKFLFLYLAFFIYVFEINAQNTISIEIPGTNTDISSQTHELELTNSESIDVSFDIINNNRDQCFIILKRNAGLFIFLV